MNKHVATAFGAAAMLAVVGVTAAAQAFKPSQQPHQQVQFVQPAAETLTPSPTTTTVTPTVTAKPKPKARQASPVTSTTSSSKAPSTVQRQAIVSETPTDPASAQTTPEPSAPPAPPSGWKPGDPKPGNIPSPTTT